MLGAVTVDAKNKRVNWERFQQARFDKQLTLRAVANLTGLSRSTVSTVETGRHECKGGNAIKLLYFYGLTPEDVLVDQAYEPPEQRGRYLYLMRDENSGAVKIGRASDPQFREKNVPRN
jgi:transcriptional regulator with XRE-family HTH domain